MAESCVMWSFMTPGSLLTFQRRAAIERIDREITENYQRGYMVDVNRLLEQRLKLSELIETGRW